MPDFEYHMGEFTNTPTEVSFTLVVRTGDGNADLGVAKLTLPKPVTEVALRAAMLNAARSMLSPSTKPREFVEELVKRMNQGL